MLGDHLAGPAHPGQLPRRQPHRLHDGADALGAAPGGLPARPRRRRLPAAAAPSTATTSLARTPVTGERDVRSEDRQLLLDAIGAATETLVVTYTGADPHSGQDRPPAVPLGELLDALDRTTEAPVRDADRGQAPAAALRPAQRRARAARHARRRSPSTRRCSPPRSAADRAAAGAAAVPRRVRWPSRSAGPATTTRAGRPGHASSATRSRGSSAPSTSPCPWDVDGVSDAMPVEIDQLETWGVGDRMLDDMLRGIHPDTRARDRVAPRRTAARPARLAQGHRGPRDRDEPRRRRAHPPPGRAAGLRRRRRAAAAAAGSPAPSRPVYGDRLVAVGYSRLDGKHLLESWVRLLALAAGHPDHNWTALTIGRAPRGTQAAQRLLGPAGEEPLTLLADLVDLYDEGRRAPLQLPLKTSFAWASAAHMGQDPKPEALKKWRSQPLPRRGRRPGPRPGLGRARRPRRPSPTCRRWPSGCGSRCSAASGGRCDASTGTPSTSWPRCRPDRPRPCSRPAPAPARPTRSAALVTRYVAEGRALLDDMLLITFSRAASQELRERVRDQLVQGGRGPRRPDAAPTTSC